MENEGSTAASEERSMLPDSLYDVSDRSLFFWRWTLAARIDFPSSPITYLSDPESVPLTFSATNHRTQVFFLNFFTSALALTSRRLSPPNLHNPSTPLPRHRFPRQVTRAGPLPTPPTYLHATSQLGAPQFLHNMRPRVSQSPKQHRLPLVS